jgi:hypothetical protein
MRFSKNDIIIGIGFDREFIVLEAFKNDTYHVKELKGELKDRVYRYQPMNSYKLKKKAKPVGHPLTKIFK